MAASRPDHTEGAYLKGSSLSFGLVFPGAAACSSIGMTEDIVRWLAEENTPSRNISCMI